MKFDLLVFFVEKKDEEGDRDLTRKFFIRCCCTSNAILLFVPRYNTALREIEFFF